MNKTVKTVLIPFVIIVALVAFIVIRVIMLSNSFDEEGFKISELTEEEIVNEPDYCRARMSKLQASGYDSGVKNDRFEEVDLDRVTYSSKRITGINTVSATRIKDATLKLYIDSELVSGNGKIVIVQDDKILEYLEFGEHKEFFVTVEGEHHVYVKILCEIAEVDVTVERQIC